MQEAQGGKDIVEQGKKRRRMLGHEEEREKGAINAFLKELM